MSAFRLSNIIELKGSQLVVFESKEDGSGHLPGGCFSLRISRVDRNSSSEPVGIMSSRLRMPPVEWRDKLLVEPYVSLRTYARIELLSILAQAT